MAIAGSPGWSESGGPWVPPAQGMKKYVWSETRVEGGRPFTGKLPKPPSTTGSFQNMPPGQSAILSEAPPVPADFLCRRRGSSVSRAFRVVHGAIAA